MNRQVRQQFLSAVLGESRGLAAFSHMADQAIAWAKSGKRLYDDSTYHDLGFANRDSYVGVMRNHAHQAFGALVREAQARLDSGFVIDGFNGREHPVQLISRAVGMLMCSGRPLLADSTYAIFGHTLQSFTDLWRRARLDRLQQNLALLSGPHFFRLPETAHLAEEVAGMVWNDFEDLGLVMTDDRHWRHLPLTREKYIDNIKDVLKVVIPALLEETARTKEHARPAVHWRSLRAAEKAIDMYGYYSGNDGEGYEIAKMPFEAFEQLMLDGFAAYMDRYLPVLQGYDGWNRYGFRVARSIEAQISEYGWTEGGMIDHIFAKYGYQGFWAFREQMGLNFARTMILRVMDGTEKGDAAHSAVCEAYATLFDDLGYDPANAKVYMQLGVTKKGFDDRWAALAAESAYTLYNEMFDAALTDQALIGLIGDLKNCLEQCEKAGTVPDDISREIMFEYERTAHVRKAGLGILEFMASAQTSKALELFEQANNALIDGNCALSDEETQKILGLTPAEAAKLEQTGTVLVLENLWRDVKDADYSVRTRYESLAQFIHAINETPELDLEASGLCARLGMQSKLQLREQTYGFAVEFARPLFAEAQRMWANNRKEAGQLLGYVTSCLNLAGDKAECDEITFRRLFGFARGVYQGMIAQTLPASAPSVNPV